MSPSLTTSHQPFPLFNLVPKSEAAKALVKRYHCSKFQFTSQSISRSGDCLVQFGPRNDTSDIILDSPNTCRFSLTKNGDVVFEGAPNPHCNIVHVQDNVLSRRKGMRGVGTAYDESRGLKRHIIPMSDEVTTNVLVDANCKFEVEWVMKLYDWSAVKIYREELAEIRINRFGESEGPASEPSRARTTGVQEQTTEDTPKVPPKNYKLVFEYNYLGGGGFGSVYEAVDILDDTIYAVKRLKSQCAESQKERLDLKSEVEHLNAHQHPNICEFQHCQGWERGPVQLFMPLYEGPCKAFFQQVRSDFRFPHQKDGLPRHVTTFIRQVLSALHFMHTGDSHLVHHDVKPENILFNFVDGSVRFYLSDFGLANSIENKSGKGGTKPYRAPETFARGKSDPKSDIYAFGITLLEYLGYMRVSFLVKNDSSWRKLMANNRQLRPLSTTKYANLNEQNVLIRDLHTRLPAHLAALVDLDPENRPTAENCLEMLTEALNF